jgi:hypothetical protein
VVTLAKYSRCAPTSGAAGRRRWCVAINLTVAMTDSAGQTGSTVLEPSFMLAASDQCDFADDFATLTGVSQRCVECRHRDPP